MRFKPHQALTVVNGRFKGLAGVVIDCDDSVQNVTLKIDGVKDSKTINETATLNFNQVRAL